MLFLAVDWGVILADVGYIFLGLVIGAVAGYFVSRKVFKDQLKKNPPISEKQIRAMYMSMGRTPTEKQIKQTMKAFNDSNK